MDQWISKIRLWSSLVLVVFVVQHLLNHAMGIVSFELAEGFRVTVGSLFQVLPGLILLYSSLVFHVLIALYLG